MGFETMNSGAEKISVKDRLIKNGIAQRMIDTIKKFKGQNNPEITFGVNDCDFKVEQIEVPSRRNPNEKEIHIQIVIVMPNLQSNKETESTVQQAFGVEEGKSFGAGGEAPLTPKQYADIQEILKIEKK